MNYSKILFLLQTVIFGLLFPASVSAQTSYPQNYFANPLDIPFALSGSFAELRTNHFHSGLDFRTNGTIGYPVYAVADGYVSRIKISAAGGGKTLYITHPNGYKSVYMHLDCFWDKIAEYVETYQYDNKVFEFDINLDERQLPVKKRMQVAKSGNTGSSGGPHLHFEIRQADNDMTIHPALFGYKLCDQTPPTINGVRIYPADATALVAGANEVYNYSQSAKAAKKSKTKKQPDTIPVWGNCYFGIDVFDQLCSSIGKCGIYQLKLFIDNKQVYSHCLKQFMFEDTRYINALIDFEYFLKSRKRYMLTRLPDFTPIPIYEQADNKGVFLFTDNEKHLITYEAADYAGNSSKFSFWVKSSEPAKKDLKTKPEPAIPNSVYFVSSKKNSIKLPDIFMEMDENTLYESTRMYYQVFKSATKHDTILCYRICKEEIPLHKPYRLGILANKIPESLRKKAFVARREANTKLYYEKSTWEDDFLIATPRAFGVYTIALDTVPPQIKPLNFQNNLPLKGNGTVSLKIKITDDFSGVETYNCYLNNAWILAEYDKKNNLLTISTQAKLQKGNNDLKIFITDAVRNECVENFVIKLL